METNEIKNIIGWAAFIMTVILFVHFNVFRLSHSHLSDADIVVYKYNYLIAFLILPFVGFWGTKKRD